MGRTRTFFVRSRNGQRQAEQGVPNRAIARKTRRQGRRGGRTNFTDGVKVADKHRTARRRAGTGSAGWLVVGDSSRSSADVLQVVGDEVGGAGGSKAAKTECLTRCRGCQGTERASRAGRTQSRVNEPGGPQLPPGKMFNVSIATSARPTRPYGQPSSDRSRFGSVPWVPWQPEHFSTAVERAPPGTAAVRSAGFRGWRAGRTTRSLSSTSR